MPLTVVNQVSIAQPFLHHQEALVRHVIIQQEEVQHALQSNVMLEYTIATATLQMVANLPLIVRQLQLFKERVQLAVVRRHVQQLSAPQTSLIPMTTLLWMDARQDVVWWHMAHALHVPLGKQVGAQQSLVMVENMTVTATPLTVANRLLIARQQFLSSEEVRVRHAVTPRHAQQSLVMLARLTATIFRLMDVRHVVKVCVTHAPMKQRAHLVQQILR